MAWTGLGVGSSCSAHIQFHALTNLQILELDSRRTQHRCIPSISSSPAFFWPMVRYEGMLVAESFSALPPPHPLSPFHSRPPFSTSSIWLSPLSPSPAQKHLPSALLNLLHSTPQNPLPSCSQTYQTSVARPRSPRWYMFWGFFHFLGETNKAQPGWHTACGPHRGTWHRCRCSQEPVSCGTPIC